jgi:DNA modification methylase
MMWHISGRGSLNGALSKFPQEVGRTIVLFYTEPGDTIVDPFAGHNSRMDLCVKAGRNYIGCDLSKDFMEFNRRRADILRKRFPKAEIQLHHCDSRKQPIADSVGDFTLTSPPYWDIEYYGDEDEQLGKIDSYEEFMDGMEEVLAENFRTLKSGAYSAWFINDFRKDKVFYFYHMDIAERGRRVGFIPHDILVVDLGRCVRDCFINQAVELKILPKRHEYAVIFRKP